MNTAGEKRGDDRLQLLMDMGIDVWRQRLPAGTMAAAMAGSGRGRAEQVVPEPPGVVDAPASGRSRQSRRSPATDRPAARGVSPAAPPRSDAPAVPTGGPEVAPFRLLCVAAPGAVVVVEPSEVRAARRFCRDLLNSVTGQWQTSCTELVFEWPEHGVDRDEASMARALRAFVDGQAVDHGQSLLVVDAKVADRLRELPPTGCEVIPPVDQLMTDGALKRAVWTRISGLRSA